MSCIDWKKIKAEYIAGGTSYRRLAEKYSCSFVTLSKVAKREGWPELRRQQEYRQTTKMVESISAKEAKKAIDIIDVADKLLEKALELMDNVPLDTQSFKQLTSALKDLKDIKGYKSAIDLKEQEARIRNLERQAEADATKDTTVIVQLDGDISEWAK